MSFDKLGIKQDFINILNSEQITEPTDIQKQTIPLLMAGKDIIAESQTGTGKTLAYVLPILHRINSESKDVQAVILVPTRELGMQILRDIELLTAGGAIRSQALIGGAAIKRQVERLRQRPHIVVGTPGRILELINMRKLTMHFVKTIIIDEADHMFMQGSSGEVDRVLKGALRDRQIAFFSATIPANIEQAGKRWMNDPVIIRVNPSEQTAASIEHLYFVCEQRDKIDELRKIVRLFEPPAAIVFVTGTTQIAELEAKLLYHGLEVAILYGEATKVERATTLSRFREGKVQVIIATDVAARGLDIEEVTHVINFDPPIDESHYVHRVGRTGRAGQEGTAISLVTAKEEYLMARFSKRLNIQIQKKRMYKGTVMNAGDRKR